MADRYLALPKASPGFGVRSLGVPTVGQASAFLSWMYSLHYHGIVPFVLYDVVLAITKAQLKGSVWKVYISLGEKRR